MISLLQFPFYLLQATRNFQNIDATYVKQLCGTILNGPKLPEV